MDADVQTQPRTLEEFFASTEDAVSRGIPPDPAPVIAQGETYPAVRDFFLTHPALVAEWLSASTGEEELRAAKKFVLYKKDIFASPVAELEQLRHEKEMPAGPVVPIREQAIAGAGSELQQHQKQKGTAVQSEYARKVAQNFVTQLREQRLYGTPDEIEKAVDRELNKPVYAETEKEIKTELVENISQAPEFSQDRHAAKTIAEDILTGSDEFIRETRRETTIDIAAAKKIIEDPTIIDGKTFVETFTKNSAGNNQPLGEQLDYAVAAARAATVVNAPRLDVEGMQVGGMLTRIPGVKEAAIREAFTNAWNRTVNAEGFIETMTTRLGAEAVRSDIFQQMIKSGTDVAQQKHAAGAVVGSLGKIAGDVLVSVKGPPSEEMLHYISALYQKQASGNAAAAPNSVQFIVTMLYSYSPGSFSASSAGGGLSGWILRWGAQKAAGTAAKEVGKAVAGKVAVGGISKLLGGILAPSTGGLSIAASFLVDGALSIGGKILGGITGGLGFLASGAWLGGKDIPASSILTLGPLFIIIAIVFLPFFVSFSGTTRNAAIVTSYAGGGEGPGEVVGPIEYTGPTPSGPLQCLNYNVTPKRFDDVNAHPFTPAQGSTVNQALNEYPQLGLYNCLLSCPQNKINLYQGGASPWWGWAAGVGEVVIYDGFFAASAGNHLRARLIAHELAHEMSYIHPDIRKAFFNGTTSTPKGYCGCLGTYPSGKRRVGACSPLETPDETFAEAAAMFLTGENLQSLCQPAYNFMSNIFKECAVK